MFRRRLWYVWIAAATFVLLSVVADSVVDVFFGGDGLDLANSLEELFWSVLLTGAATLVLLRVWLGQEAHYLRERETARTLYEATAVNLADGLAIMDRDDRIMFFNPRLEALFGIPRDQAVGRPLSEVTATLHDRALDPRQASQRSRQASEVALAGSTDAFEYRLGGDPPRDLAVLDFPIHGRDGASFGHGRLVREVTRERELDRLKNEVIAIVSHELRAPMTVISGFAELLQTRDLSEAQVKEYAARIQTEATRLGGLINEFLDVQRLESRRGRLSLVPVELPRLFGRAAAAAGDDASRPIRVRLPGELPPVLADPERILQVLGNLLSNGRKYSPDGGDILISARQERENVVIEVADQGLGLPSDALPHLFEKFFRVDGQDRRGITGTGLGLAICRQIVEAHGGSIWAESDGPRRGARFCFTLPVARFAMSGEPEVATSATDGRAVDGSRSAPRT